MQLLIFLLLNNLQLISINILNKLKKQVFIDAMFVSNMHRIIVRCVFYEVHKTSIEHQESRQFYQMCFELVKTRDNCQQLCLNYRDANGKTISYALFLFSKSKQLIQTNQQYIYNKMYLKIKFFIFLFFYYVLGRYKIVVFEWSM